jgi:hypothetical protein
MHKTDAYFLVALTIGGLLLCFAVAAVCCAKLNRD